MNRWIFGTFAGWLLRKQLNVLIDLVLAIIRLTRRGVKALPHGNGRDIKIAKSEEDGVFCPQRRQGIFQKSYDKNHLIVHDLRSSQRRTLSTTIGIRALITAPATFGHSE